MSPRGFRDEDRQYDREEREPVTIKGVTSIGESGHAVLCLVDGREIWIPKSQIHDDSEVFADDQTGKLVISAWLAERERLA